MRAWVIATLVVVGSIAGGPPALAKRAATSAERAAAIKVAKGAAVRMPERCWIVTVSTVDRRFGSVGVRRTGCPVGDGFWVVRRPSVASLRWRVAYLGTYMPCTLISRSVRRDLFGGMPCDSPPTSSAPPGDPGCVLLYPSVCGQARRMDEPRAD